jgi:tetratricopeptide (TPR) repeat protein
VQPIAAASRRDASSSADPQEQRRRAFVALRELFDRIADRRPVVVWIDDLQWGDLDSVAILAELLRPPDVPPILLIGTYRSEDATRSASLRAILEQVRPVRSIELAALSPAEAETLAYTLLGSDPALLDQATRIAAEANGVPFFVDELVRHWQSRGESREGARLEDALQARIMEFPAEARAVLEAVALCGRPVPREVALRACSLEGAVAETALSVLRAGHLVRATRAAERPMVEVYPDRIREAVVGRLDAARRVELHTNLAGSFRELDHADPEELLAHYVGAGDDATAHEQAVRAADRAFEALAFDRAARFYETALSLASGSTNQLALHWKLGDALANAGRGGDAAGAYRRAIEGSPASEALELKKRIAEELLRSGRFEEGLDAVREVLHSVGIRFPDTALGALLALLWSMLLVRLRGRGWVARDSSQLSQEAIRRIDVCWSVNATLTLADPIRALAFQKQHVLRALAAGEPSRVARALSTELVASSTRGGGHAQATEVIRVAATEVAQAVDTPHAHAVALMCTGMAWFFEGRSREAREVEERSLTLLRSKCTGAAWEIGCAETVYVWSLWRLGELRELVRRVSRLLQEATERGDLGLGINLRLGLPNAVWLVEDEPDRAIGEIELAVGRLGGRRVPLQTYYETMARVNVAIYRGAGEHALSLLVERMPMFRRAQLFRVDNTFLDALFLRGRAALAAAETAADPSAALSRAWRDARALARSQTRWAPTAAEQLRAGVLARRGDRAAALDSLRRAIAGYDRLEMTGFAASCRAQLGVLVEGTEASEARAAAQRFMREQGVKDPARFVRLLAPGIGAPLV